jgi:hypothetical protein
MVDGVAVTDTVTGPEAGAALEDGEIDGDGVEEMEAPISVSHASA